MPNDPDEKRSPAETAQLAREVMRRMIESPPRPHEKLRKESRGRKSSLKMAVPKKSPRK